MYFYKKLLFSPLFREIHTNILIDKPRDLIIIFYLCKYLPTCVVWKGQLTARYYWLISACYDVRSRINNRANSHNWRAWRPIKYQKLFITSPEKRLNTLLLITFSHYVVIFLLFAKLLKSVCLHIPKLIFCDLFIKNNYSQF